LPWLFAKPTATTTIMDETTGMETTTITTTTTSTNRVVESGGGSSSVVDDDNENNNTNRFTLELEFVQSLASPAYLHYLACMTNSEGQSLLLDPPFRAFLVYLQNTWSEPEYSRYIIYPHALFFLDLLIHHDTFCRELAQVSFRNFCHQQQYFAWQNRFSTLYGVGDVADVQNLKPTEDGMTTTTAVLDSAASEEILADAATVTSDAALA
jgi:mediator of RNA polymerase II transcription subunit 31